MVLHNPNNWHWVSKDASGWTRDYLENNLSTISADEDGVTAKIDKVTDLDGDVDVSQRKGKVITIFDFKLDLEWSGKTSEGKDVSGTIKIPEIMHDTAEDEYVFNIDMYSPSDEKQPVKDLIRRSILPQLRSRLQKLGPALITEHGRDIQHAPGSNPSSGFSTPKYLSNTQINKSSDRPGETSTLHTAGGKGAPAINVITLNASDEFRTTAEELYSTFTNPQRLAAFTRGVPKRFDGAKVGGCFELFDGNVTGEFIELTPPTGITQKWRLRQWPEGHYSTLKIRFDQNNEDQVTMMNVQWDGVPIGQEDVARRNWGEYYVRSIKTTFGFGTVL